jgi:hypothetical protein
MKPRSKSMPDLRADSLRSRHTLHLNHNKHQHTQVSTQLIPPLEICDLNKVMISKSTTPKHVMPMDVRKNRAQWLRRQFRTLRTHISLQFRYPLRQDDFVRYIIIEVPDSGSFVRRRARALFDTGCSKNLMSRTMAITVRAAAYLTRTGEPIMNTLGKDKFRSLGRVDRRWASINQHLDTKFYDAEWEVSDKPEDYDVIIGRDTMTENNLIKLCSILG